LRCSLAPFAWAAAFRLQALFSSRMARPTLGMAFSPLSDLARRNRGLVSRSQKSARFACYGYKENRRPQASARHRARGERIFVERQPRRRDKRLRSLDPYLLKGNKELHAVMHISKTRRHTFRTITQEKRAAFQSRRTRRKKAAAF
jgi:hypothetical protein